MSLHLGLQRYLYAALARDLACSWHTLTFRRIDQAPSALPSLRPLLMAIAPWGNTAPEVWDRLVLLRAKQNLLAHRGSVPPPLEWKEGQDIRVVRPPATWDDLEVNLRFKLDSDLRELDDDAFSALFHGQSVVAGFREYAASRSDSLLRRVNLENPISVCRFARELIEESAALPLPHRAEQVGWALLLLSRGTEGRTRGCCELCFRRPHVQLRFCAEHAQAYGLKKAGGAYQRGVRLRAFMMQRGTWPLGHAAFVDSLTLAESYRLEELFGGADHEAELAWPAIVAALARAPVVAIRFGLEAIPELRPVDGLRLLRERLDPEERSPGAWPWKIAFAEAMEVAAAQLAHRRRGRGRKKDLAGDAPVRYEELASQAARCLAVPIEEIDQGRKAVALLAALKPFIGPKTKISIG